MGSVAVFHCSGYSLDQGFPTWGTFKVVQWKGKIYVLFIYKYLYIYQWIVFPKTSNFEINSNKLSWDIKLESTFIFKNLEVLLKIQWIFVICLNLFV